ncbi:MAG: hypothetical protein AB1595_07250 [bacterium]
MTRPQAGNVDTAEAKPPNVIIERSRRMNLIGNTYLPYSPFPQFSNWSPPESPATNTNRPTIRVTIRSRTNILANSIVMRIDGATVTPTLSPSSDANTIDVSYTPTTALSDGTHTVSIYARNELNLEDEATNRFFIDSTPPKIKKVRIFSGEKKGNNIINAMTRYEKDYTTGSITSKPLFEGSIFVEITFDEPLDPEKPLNVFFMIFAY